MNTYLSVDIDYWFNHSSPKSINSLKRILEKVKNVPDKLLVDEHHNLLDQINSSQCDKIIHVDYHQDLVFETEGSFGKVGDKIECGNFLYFVNNKENIDFDWYYPDYDECVRKGLGFCMDLSFKPLSKKNFVYKDQKRKCGLPTNKELENVTSVGIAFSFDYLSVEYGRILDFIKVLSWLTEMFDFETVKGTMLSYPLLKEWEEGQEILYLLGD